METSGQPEVLVVEQSRFDKVERALDGVLDGWEKSGYFRYARELGYPRGLPQSGWDYTRDLGGVDLVYRLIRFKGKEGDEPFVMFGVRKEGQDEITDQKTTGSYIKEIEVKGDGGDRVVTLKGLNKTLTISNNGYKVESVSNKQPGSSRPSQQ